MYENSNSNPNATKKYFINKSYGICTVFPLSKTSMFETGLQKIYSRLLVNSAF